MMNPLNLIDSAQRYLAMHHGDKTVRYELEDSRTLGAAHRALLLVTGNRLLTLFDVAKVILALETAQADLRRDAQRRVLEQANAYQAAITAAKASVVATELTKHPFTRLGRLHDSSNTHLPGSTDHHE